MGRQYGFHHLSDERRKIAEDNVHFVWYYYGKYIRPRYAHLKENELEEISAQMLFFFCQAVENWDPKRGKLTTIAALYFKSGINAMFGSKSVFLKKHSLSPFLPCEDFDDEGYALGSELAWEPEEKFQVNWDSVCNLFQDAELTEQEIAIVNMKYHEGYNNLQIGEMIGVTKERARQLSKEAIVKIKRVILLNNYKTRDFY